MTDEEKRLRAKVRRLEAMLRDAKYELAVYRLDRDCEAWEAMPLKKRLPRLKTGNRDKDLTTHRNALLYQRARQIHVETGLPVYTRGRDCVVKRLAEEANLSPSTVRRILERHAKGLVVTPIRQKTPKF